MSDFRKRFRPNMYVENINQLTEYDPNYDYKNVIYTYKHDPGRITRYEDLGWEVVISTDHLTDDRAFTPTSKKEKLRPSEIISNTSDGHKQVLMCIPKKKREENRTKLMELDAKIKAEDARRRGDLIRRGAKGKNVKITGSEVN